MTTLHGRALLDAGIAILGPELTPAGFTFELGSEGHSSGGAFASGSFLNEDRRIEVHVRQSLGLVTYHWALYSMSHQDLVRGLGVRGAYPGYSPDRLDAFRDLRTDLAGPLAPFVKGDSHEWFINALDTVRDADSPPKLP